MQIYRPEGGWLRVTYIHIFSGDGGGFNGRSMTTSELNQAIIKMVLCAICSITGAQGHDLPHYVQTP